MKSEPAKKSPWDIVIKIIFAVALCALFALHFFSRDRLVYVDVQKLGAEYKGMQVARKEFEAKTAIWQANLDTLRLQAENKIKEYQKNKAKMSPQEKKLTEELIRSKQEQYQSYEQAIREKAQNEDKELSAKVVARINDYVKRYGEKNGYKIIFAATQYGNIAYANEDIDITADILKGLNAEFK